MSEKMNISFVDIVWLGKNKGHIDEERKPYLWRLISGISRKSCYHGSRSHIVVMYVIVFFTPNIYIYIAYQWYNASPVKYIFVVDM